MPRTVNRDALQQTTLERTRALVAGGAHPVVVFDVDSTLLDTAYRHHQILIEAASELRDPALATLARTLAPSAFGWDVLSVLSDHGFTDVTLHKKVRAAWARRFFTDRLCAIDEPYPTAVSFVQQLHRAGAFIYYLTGRPSQTMSVGTVTSFKRLGLPLMTHRTKLHLKADPSERDVIYKTAAMDAIRAIGQPVVATFENEPRNANAFAMAFPDALNVLVDTVHSPNPPPVDDDVVLMTGWGDRPSLA